MDGSVFYSETGGCMHGRLGFLLVWDDSIVHYSLTLECLSSTVLKLKFCASVVLVLEGFESWFFCSALQNCECLQ